MSPRSDESTPPRVTKRRAETRARMIDAALSVFAEEGFGRATIEQVCERAGYTRGAFYSNFSSLEELFLAMWEHQSSTLIQRLSEMMAALPEGHRSFELILDALLDTVPIDDEWYRVSAEFTAHALRHPPLRRVMVKREEAIAGTLLPIFTELLRDVGREVSDPAGFASAVVAVHDGTMVQCLLDPGNPEPLRRRRDLFNAVILAYTEEPPVLR